MLLMRFFMIAKDSPFCSFGGKKEPVTQQKIWEKIMRSFLYKVFLILCITAGEIRIFAMEQSDTLLNTLQAELVFYMVIGNGEIKDVAALSLLNKRWHALMESEFLWGQLYIKRMTHPEKLDDEKTYKDNFKMACEPVRVYYISPPNLLNHELIYDVGTKVIEEVSEGLSEMSSTNILAEAFQKAILKASRVVFCGYGLYHGEPTLPASQKGILDSAKEQDILLVLCAGNSATFVSSNALDLGDIHALYPNVLWVTAHDENKRLCHFANYGTLVDVAAKGKSGTLEASSSLCKFLGYMRWLRPDLKAEEVRNVMLKSVEVTDETKDKIPNGGIFNINQILINLQKLTGFYLQE